MRRLKRLLDLGSCSAKWLLRNEQNYLQEAVLKARADYSSPEWFRWRQYEVFHWPVGCDR